MRRTSTPNGSGSSNLQWGHSSEAVDEEAIEVETPGLCDLQWGHSSEAVDEGRPPNFIECRELVKVSREVVLRRGHKSRSKARLMSEEHEEKQLRVRERGLLVWGA